MEFDSTFIISAISFILFTIIMNSIFYKPLTAIMEKRTEYIDDHHSAAESINTKTRHILHEREHKLGEAKKESRSIITEGVEKAENTKTEFLSGVTENVKNKIETDKQNLVKDIHETAEILKSQVSDLSKDIAQKLLKQEIQSIEYDSGIVDEAMKDV